MSKILKVLKGPLSTFKKNRNGRVYSRELWEKVLNSEYWKDMMENNSLGGEIVHPGDRTESDVFEIDMRNVSHRVKEAYIEGDKLMGVVEILDTKAGRTVSDLIDSGMTVGISARGFGQEYDGVVDPDSYSFKCFDMTLRPSDPNARLLLQESENLKLVLQESEISDRLLDGQVPFTKQDRTKKEVMANILKRLELFNTNNDVLFKLIPRGIQITYKGNAFGNVFSTQEKSDNNNFQIDTYRVFTNIDRSFGYENIPSRGYFDSDEYDRIAKRLLTSITNKIPKEEAKSIKVDQLTLDI